MSRKFLILLIAIGIGISLVACTTGPRSQRYPRYPGGGYPPYPGGQGYPGYPGYPQQNNRMEQVQTLADHLKDATAEVTEEAKETDGYDASQTMITRLEDLEKEAKHFHETMGNSRRYDSGSPGYGSYDPRYGDPRYGDPRSGDPRYGGYPGSSDGRNSREGFTELLQKYYSARNIVRESPKEDEVQTDFERVTAIMRNLTRVYGYRFEPDYEDLQPTIR